MQRHSTRKYQTDTGRTSLKSVGMRRYQKSLKGGNGCIWCCVLDITYYNAPLGYWQAVVGVDMRADDECSAPKCKMPLLCPRIYLNGHPEEGLEIVQKFESIQIIQLAFKCELARTYKQISNIYAAMDAIGVITLSFRTYCRRSWKATPLRRKGRWLDSYVFQIFLN